MRNTPALHSTHTKHTQTLTGVQRRTSFISTHALTQTHTHTATDTTYTKDKTRPFEGDIVAGERYWGLGDVEALFWCLRCVAFYLRWCDPFILPGPYVTICPPVLWCPSLFLASLFFPCCCCTVSTQCRQPCYGLSCDSEEELKVKNVRLLANAACFPCHDIFAPIHKEELVDRII